MNEWKRKEREGKGKRGAKSARLFRPSICCPVCVSVCLCFHPSIHPSMLSPIERRENKARPTQTEGRQPGWKNETQQRHSTHHHTEWNAMENTSSVSLSIRCSSFFRTHLKRGGFESDSKKKERGRERGSKGGSDLAGCRIPPPSPPNPEKNGNAVPWSETIESSTAHGVTTRQKGAQCLRGL